MPLPCSHAYLQRTGRSSLRAAAFAFLSAFACTISPEVLASKPVAPSAPSPSPGPASTTAPSGAPPQQTLYIREYRVIGAKILPRPEVEEAVYSYLGPGRTAEDVEQARAALEKAYKDKGFQTVSVTVPEQRGARGIIILQVTEATIGRLRVHGSRYYDINQIKRQAASLAEGKVPDFNAVQKDIVAMNQTADMQVTPSIKPGAIPGTFDVDLEVKDKLPLHGSVELNNRYSANTTPLRLNVDLRYSNLWQMGHTIGVGFQVAPERVSDALVFSAFYIAPVPGVSWLSLMAQAVRQNSDVSTLGGAAVAGNGEIYGGRLLFTLPNKPGFFESAGFGLDYKHFTQDLSVGDTLTGTPITYWPFTASYNGTWVGKGRETDLNASLVFHFRGMGSGQVEFDNRRYNADGNFFYIRGSLAHTQDIPGNFQVYGQIQGQGCATPLVDSEEFSLGGLNTVRGYLESTVLGDSAVVGNFEVRSPSLLWWAGAANECRLFGFLDGGTAYVNDALPQQVAQYNLWSYGFGSTIRLFDHLHGSVLMGVPMISQTGSEANHPFFSFRFWGDL